MELIDYRNVDNISLKDTGLISLSNTSLIDFFNKNGIVTVGNLLRIIDNNDYKYEGPKELINEVLGLVDILRFKYFDISFDDNGYLESYIREEEFMVVLNNTVKLPAVKYINGKKINIYSAITRLGFNDKERSLLLKVNFDKNDKLIDMLESVYVELSDKNDLSDDDKVLFNKLFLYLKGFGRINIRDDESEKYDYIYSKLEELEGLYIKRQIIDDRINELMNILSQYGIVPKDGKKK